MKSSMVQEKQRNKFIGIVQNMLDHDIHSILITRVNDEKAKAILKEFPQIIYDELSHICYIDEEKKKSIKGKLSLFVQEHRFTSCS